jgi:hypothetical protein
MTLLSHQEGFSDLTDVPRASGQTSRVSAPDARISHVMWVSSQRRRSVSRYTARAARRCASSSVHLNGWPPSASSLFRVSRVTSGELSMLCLKNPGASNSSWVGYACWMMTSQPSGPSAGARKHGYAGRLLVRALHPSRAVNLSAVMSRKTPDERNRRPTAPNSMLKTTNSASPSTIAVWAADGVLDSWFDAKPHCSASAWRRTSWSRVDAQSGSMLSVTITRRGQRNG